MKRSYLFLIIAVLIFINTLSLYSDNSYNGSETIDLHKIDISKLPYNLVPDSRKLGTYSSIFTVDLNNDGKTELIQLVNTCDLPEQPNKIQIRNIFPDSFINNVFPGQLFNPVIMDINSDGKQEILLPTMREDSSLVYILDQNLTILNRIGLAYPDTLPLHILENGWKCHIQPLTVFDVNNDTKNDLICAVRTSWGFYPRGIFVFNLETNSVIKKVEVGAYPIRAQVIDIDNDHKNEIIFGSSAPNNSQGAVINGLHDSSCYLYMISPDLKSVDSEKFGGIYTSIQPFQHDLDHDGTVETILYFRGHSEPKPRGYITFWDFKNWRRNNIYTFERELKTPISFIDINKDGTDEIITAWDDGSIKILNSDFSLLNQIKIKDFLPMNYTGYDLNLDGESEILISGKFHTKDILLVFDTKLTLLSALYDFTINPQSCIIDLGYGTAKRVLAQKNKDYYVLSLQKQIFTLSSISWKEIGWGVLLSSLVIIGLFYIYLHKRNKSDIDNLLQILVDKTNEPAFILSEDQRIIVINSKIENFLNINKNHMIHKNINVILKDTKWQDISDIIDSFKNSTLLYQQKQLNLSYADWQKNLNILFFKFQPLHTKKYYRLITIQDISSKVHSENIFEWAVVAQKLAHEIKSPLSTIRLATQQLHNETKSHNISTSGNEVYLERILNQVKRLHKLTDAFLKLTRLEKGSRESVNLNNLIDEVLDSYRYQTAGDIKIENKYQDIPEVNADRQQIIIVLKNLIDNSCKAMQKSGVLTFTTRFIQSLDPQNKERTIDAVQFEISDTGIGISSDDMQYLFQPFFSKTVNGTGLGLVITKKIIEDHNGTIEIHSEINIGTTVKVTLPCNGKI